MDLRAVVSNDTEDANWDRFVIDNDGGHYTQMAVWGKVKRVQGWKIIRILLKDEQERTHAGAQILWKPTHLGMNMGYVSKGPLCEDHGPALATCMLQCIKSICKEWNIHYLAIQPPNDRFDLDGLLHQYGFSPSHQGDLEKPATIKLDIAMDVDQIFEQIRPKKRRSIRKAMQTPFYLHEGSRKDLETFYHLHTITGERCVFPIQSWDFFQELWDEFYARGMLGLHLCEFNGETIASSIVICYKNMVEKYRLGWSGGSCNLFFNEALDWHIIQWAKNRGFCWYDLCGIDSKLADVVLATGEVPEDKKNTFSAYKLHYSHNIVRSPQTYEYLFHPICRVVYRFMMICQPIRYLCKIIYQQWLQKR